MITPNEIRNKEFTKKLGGYEKTDVDDELINYLEDDKVFDMELKDLK